MTNEKDNLLVEDVKRAIIDFCNREYEENHSYDEFHRLYSDTKHIGILILIHRMKGMRFSMN